MTLDTSNPNYYASSQGPAFTLTILKYDITLLYNPPPLTGATEETKAKAGCQRKKHNSSLSGSVSVSQGERVMMVCGVRIINVCVIEVFYCAQHSYTVGLHKPNEFIYRQRREIGGGWAGFTKICRLSWLTNSARVSYVSPNAGGGGKLRGLSE